MSCTVCAYAHEHSCWPPDHRGTHCKDCHRSWEGTAEIHCVVCHRQFSCSNTLEFHKHGTQCLDPAEVLWGETDEPRFRIRDSKYGVVWVRVEERDPPRVGAESPSRVLVG